MEQKYFYEAFQKLFSAAKDILGVYQKEEFYRLLFRGVYELSGDEMYDSDSIRKVTSGGQTIHLRAVKQLCTDTGFELFRKEIERHIAKIDGIDVVVDFLLGICKKAEGIPAEITRQIEDSLGGHTAYQLSRGIAAILVCLNQADYNNKRKKNSFPDTGFMRLTAGEALPLYPRYITDGYSTATDEAIGREDELQEVYHTIIGTESRILITGVGGLGKTIFLQQLLTFLMNTPAEESGIEKIAWIPYDNHDIRLSMKRAFHLKCGVEDVWQSVQEQCADYREKMLLVVDNIESVEQDEYLRKLSSLPCRILATSRQRSLTGFKEWQLEPLTMEQCRTLFYRHYQFPDRDNETLNDIIELTAKLTIMIVFLGKVAYLEELSLYELYRRLVERGFKLSEEDVSCGHEKLQNDETIIRQMCILFSLVDYSEADRELLTYISVIPTLSFDLPQAKRWFKIKKNSYLLRLYQMGMLEHTLEERRHIYWMHSVIAAAVREQQKKVLYETAAPFIHVLSEEMELGDTWGKGYTKLYLIPFSWSVADIFEDHWGNEEDSVFLLRLYYICFEASNYPVCMRLIKQVIEIDTGIGTKEMLIRDYRNYSELLLRIDHVGEAIEKLDTARGLMLEHDPAQKQKREWAYLWHSYGNIYYHSGEPMKALDYYTDALEIDLKIKDLPPDELSTDYSSIAAVYQMCGDLSSAYEMLKKAIETDEKTELDSERMMNYYYLATLCTDFISNGYEEYTEEAWDAYEMVLNFREKYFSKDSQDLADVYQEYANFLYQINALDEAARYCGKAQKIYEKVYGKESYHVLQCLSTEALILAERGQSEEAISLYEEIMERETALQDLPLSDLCNDYQNYADLLEHADRYQESEQYYKKCIDLLMEGFSEDIPRLAQPYLGMANCLMGQERYREAVQYLEKLKAITEGDILLERVTYHKLGTCHVLLKEYEIAVQEFEAARALCDEHGETDEGYILVDLCLTCRFMEQDDKAREYEILARDFAKKVDDAEYNAYVHTLDTNPVEK